jgi:miniconductance mechanosensitive channel
MILPEEKYPSIQLDPKWLTNFFNVDPQVAYIINVPIFIWFNYRLFYRLDFN